MPSLRLARERRGAASNEFTGAIFAFLAACLCQGRVPGCAPGGAVTCLLRRQEKVTKEKATPLSVSPSLRYGATCGAPLQAGSAQTRFTAFRSNSARP